MGQVEQVEEGGRGQVEQVEPVELVERSIGEDWKIIYTTGTVNQPGFDSVQWHSDGRSFSGKRTGQRVTSSCWR